MMACSAQLATSNSSERNMSSSTQNYISLWNVLNEIKKCLLTTILSKQIFHGVDKNRQSRIFLTWILLTILRNLFLNNIMRRLSHYQVTISWRIFSRNRIYLSFVLQVTLFDIFKCMNPFNFIISRPRVHPSLHKTVKMFKEVCKTI